jgi:glycosyltransferase involved in cell wall biosynthesis
MAKIYWLSDSSFTVTGFATISTNIMNGLVDAGHEVIHQPHNYMGQTIIPPITFEDGRQLKFKVMGTGLAPYSQDVLSPRIKEMKVDIFGVLLDTFMLYPWSLNLDTAPAKTIFYFPSDGGGGLPLRCENVLKKFHYPVAMSKFAQRQLKEIHGIDSTYIPHAIDTKNYFPLTDKEKYDLKCKWGLQDKFVVGSVYRNQGRKMPDRMIKAFALFAKKCPEAVLLLHTDAYDNAAVFDTVELVNRLGISNRVMFTGMKFYKGFDYKAMNDVYNIMDVFFLSTSGEGFGVPIIEAMACEIPVVCTDYTTTPELLVEEGICGIPVALVGTEDISMANWIEDRHGKNSYELKQYDEAVSNGTLTGNWNVERALMDIKDGASALETLYKGPSLRKAMGKVGREKVMKEYSWDVTIPKWNKLIKQIMEE